MRRRLTSTAMRLVVMAAGALSASRPPGPDEEGDGLEKTPPSVKTPRSDSPDNLDLRAVEDAVRNQAN